MQVISAAGVSRNKRQKIDYAAAGIVEDVKDGLRGYGNKQVTDT